MSQSSLADSGAVASLALRSRPSASSCSLSKLALNRVPLLHQCGIGLSSVAVSDWKTQRV